MASGARLREREGLFWGGAGGNGGRTAILLKRLGTSLRCAASSCAVIAGSQTDNAPNARRRFRALGSASQFDFRVFSDHTRFDNPEKTTTKKNTHM